MPLATPFPSSIRKDGPEKPDSSMYVEGQAGPLQLFVQYAETDGKGEDGIDATHNFIMIVYQARDVDQADGEELQVVRIGKIAYGKNDLCIWLGIGMSSHQDERGEVVSTSRQLSKLTSRAVLEPCVRIYENMDKNALHVSQFLSDEAIPIEGLEFSDVSRAAEDGDIDDAMKELTMWHRIFEHSDENTSSIGNPPSTAGTGYGVRPPPPPPPPLPPPPPGSPYDSIRYDPNQLLVTKPKHGPIDPEFDGDDLEQSKEYQFAFSGHVIAMRWGWDPCLRQKVLDISTKPEEEQGIRRKTLVMEGPFLNVDGTSFNIEGYVIRSYRSTIHPQHQHMESWLRSSVAQALLRRHIRQGGELETVITLIVGEDASASMETAASQLTTAGHRLAEMSETDTHASQTDYTSDRSSQTSGRSTGLRQYDQSSFNESVKGYRPVVKSRL